MTEEITVPKWALEYILDWEWLLCDEGPHDERWPSEKMLAAIKAIKEKMELPK